MVTVILNLINYFCLKPYSFMRNYNVITHNTSFCSRSAIEILEAELRESTCNLNTSSLERVISDQQTTVSEILKKQDNNIVSTHY